MHVTFDDGHWLQNFMTPGCAAYGRVQLHRPTALHGSFFFLNHVVLRARPSPCPRHTRFIVSLTETSIVILNVSLIVSLILSLAMSLAVSLVVSLNVSLTRSLTNSHQPKRHLSVPPHPLACLARSEHLS